MMKRSGLFGGARVLIAICTVLLLSGVVAVAADEPANVGGSWEMAFEGPRGTVNQTLAIEQDGGKIKGTVKSQRGEAPFEGSVEGNKIAFSVKRETPNGQFVIEYKGTVDGDAMKGTLQGGGGRFSGEWTAKRGKN